MVSTISHIKLKGDRSDIAAISAGYTEMISLIWAQDENGLIGKDGQLPW